MKKITPMKAIRLKCLECSCGSNTEVRERPIKKCPLYPYRSGHRPKTDILSTEDTETPNTAPIYGVNGAEDEITEEGTNGL